MVITFPFFKGARVSSPDVWLWVASIVLVLVGLAGTILPALPGPPLVFGGLLLAAWIHDFERVGYVVLGVLGTLTLLTVILDVIATMLGAKRVGASRAGVIGSALGTVVGLFFGFAGLVFGPFVGALIGELSARRGVLSAGRVAVVTWIALLLAVVVKLGVLFAMIGIFVFAYLL
jgi:uncharacterized protein YqgC (DUF456 family)